MQGSFSVNRKDLWALTLVEPTGENLVPYTFYGWVLLTLGKVVGLQALDSQYLALLLK